MLQNLLNTLLSIDILSTTVNLTGNEITFIEPENIAFNTSYITSRDYLKTVYYLSSAAWLLSLRNFLYVTTGQGGKRTKVYYDEIYYIEALSNYAIIYSKECKHVVYISLKEIQNKIASDKFIRIHKSYIINSDYINEIQGNRILLENNKEIAIGKTYKSEFYQYIDQFTL